MTIKSLTKRNRCKVLSINLGVDVYPLVVEAAERDGVSVSAFVRRVCRDAVAGAAADRVAGPA